MSFEVTPFLRQFQGIALRVRDMETIQAAAQRLADESGEPRVINGRLYWPNSRAGIRIDVTPDDSWGNG
jgi:hypothetical protein